MAADASTAANPRPGRECYRWRVSTEAAPLPVLPPAVRDLVDRLQAEPSVRRVILFGSRARGDAQPRSDVDLAIDAPDMTSRDWLRVADLADEAETLLKVDLVRLDQASPELRQRIEAEGRDIDER
jgi:predicted nucleotidyltransferase